jgi:hypothetical protein
MLRRIYGPVQEKGHWYLRGNIEIYSLYKDLNIMDDTKIRRLGWAGHKNGRRRIPKKGSKWEIPQQKISGKTKNKMGGRPEGCITGPSNTRLEETSLG